METLAADLGSDVQFVVLSESGAEDFVSLVSLPIFRDDSFGRTAWFEMSATAQKHDTLVFDADGNQTFYWDVGSNDFFNWEVDIRAALDAL